LRRSGATPCPSISGVSYVSDKVETDERQYLCEIERQYNVQVERFQIEPLLGLVRGAEEQIRAIEAPFLDYMWGVTRRLHERSAASGARTLLSGHWGDQVLFSSAYLIDLFRRLRWRSIGRHSREYRRYFGKAETRVLLRRFAVDLVRYHVPRRIARPLKLVRLRFFDRQRPKPWFAPAFLDSALRFRYRPAMFGSAFHSAHARAVYIEARSKYHVQCMEWNNKVGALHGLDVAFPFLDRDLLAFLMAIPGEVHAHDGVPRVLLREAMRGVLPDPVRARTWKSDFSGFVNSGLSDDAPVILQALSEKCLGVKYGFLDPERLVPALALLAEGLNAPNCEDSWELGDTYGLEVWLQVFSNGVASDQSRVAALTTGEL
jgi:asparagine synthetase B (glutamine-hydrolysing)